MLGKAYWISPRGVKIEVSTKHINSILKNPKLYGLKKSDILKTYAKHGERIGTEGEARGEIMIDLMKRGWLRIRYIPRNDMWTIQTYYFGKREKNNIWDWVADAYNKGIANAHADVRILIIKNGRAIKSSFSKLGKGQELFEILKGKSAR